jgi:hypothetical protein
MATAAAKRRETELLHRAKAILAQWSSLHCLSVRIGQLEKLADSGIADAEIQIGRASCRERV